MPNCCHSEPLQNCHSGCSANEKPTRFYHGSVYHAAPSAPTLEISINQHNPSSCQSSPCSRYVSTPNPKPISNVAAGVQKSSAPPFRRPPESPPPPPPIQQQEYANPDYLLQNKRPNRDNSRRQSWHQLGRNASMRAVKAGNTLRQRLYIQKNGLIFRVCLAEFVLSALLLALGILCACKTREFCPYYSAIWTSAVFLLNAGIGLAASKLDTTDFYVAHLVLSLASFALSAIGAVISAVNWLLIGTYKHKIERGRQLMNPKADEEQMYRAFCLLGEHDARRISYIYSHMDQYDFTACLFGIKIGIAVNSLHFLLTIILGLLFLISTILCLLRTCTSCNGNGGNSSRTNKK